MVSPILFGIGFFALITLVSFSKKLGEIIIIFILATVFSFALTIGMAEGAFFLPFLIFAAIGTIWSTVNQAQAISPDTEPPEGKFGFSQPRTVLLTIALGLAFTFFLLRITNAVQFNLLGVPTFSTVTVGLTNTLTPTIAGALGLIENRFFFTLRRVFSRKTFEQIFIPFTAIPFGAFVIPVASTILGFVSGALLFGFFHVSAYAAAAGQISFAIIIFLVWQFAHDSGYGLLFADTSHFWWNFILVSSAIGLSIA